MSLLLHTLFFVKRKNLFFLKTELGKEKRSCYTSKYKKGGYP
jgi:hypothetical protein